jgi:cation transporter-like permease
MVERISVLIDIVNNDDFANNFNNSTMNDILGEMVAFNIHAKLLKDKAAIDISSSLLRFTERLDTLNIDAFHVIKAHINALKVAFLNKSENLDKDAILGPLMTELLDVCSRYNKKYS